MDVQCTMANNIVNGNVSNHLFIENSDNTRKLQTAKTIGMSLISRNSDTRHD